MKVKKVVVEYTNRYSAREETHTSTVKIGHKYMKNFSKTSIAKEFKIDSKRRFFMFVSCVGGVKYNFYNEGKKNEPRRN